MTSKERVLTAISHQVPDRVPMDFHTNPGIEAGLKRRFGLAQDDREGLLQALHVDLRRINPAYTGPKLHQDIPERRVTIWGAVQRWVEHSAGGYWDFCDYPLKDANAEDIARFPFPDPDDYDYEAFRANLVRAQEYCVFIGSGGWGCLINPAGSIFSMDRVLMGLALEDEAVFLYMKRKTDTELAMLERMLEKGKGLIDMLHMGEDLGTQRGPIIHPDMYRRLIKPVHERFTGLAKSYGVKVMFHSCGSSSWAYDDLISIGVDVVQTLQPEATNMTPEYLKGNFGGRLAFHGCISTGGSLAFGTVDELKEEVRETLDIMMPGGGYILAPTHQIQDNSPLENVAALYETGLEYGRYGGSAGG